MKKIALVTMILLTLVGATADTVFATAPNTEQPIIADEPTIEATAMTNPENDKLQTESSRLKWGLHYSIAGMASIPKENAMQLGLTALANFFGADMSQLGNYVFEMTYNPADETHRSTWNGAVFFPNDRTAHPDGIIFRSHDVFRFRLDAQTGDLVSLQFFPSEDPTARPNSQTECMGSLTHVFEYRDKMTALRNIEFANHAMRYAEQANILESEILRAATFAGGWMMGRGESIELVVAVAIESTTGETVTLTFQGQNRKELVGVDFTNHPDVFNWTYR